MSPLPDLGPGRHHGGSGHDDLAAMAGHCDFCGLDPFKPVLVS